MSIALDYIMRFAGLPYRWQGDDPMQGFDCSGFAQEFLKSCGQTFPQDMTADGLYRFYLVYGVLSSQELGALAFYGSQEKIIHVAVMVDEKRVFEFGGGGSKTNTLEDAINQNACGRIRMLQHRKDLVAVMMPDYGFAI